MRKVFLTGLVMISLILVDRPANANVIDFESFAHLASAGGSDSNVSYNFQGLAFRNNPVGAVSGETAILSEGGTRVVSLYKEGYLFDSTGAYLTATNSTPPLLTWEAWLDDIFVGFYPVNITGTPTFFNFNFTFSTSVTSYNEIRMYGGGDFWIDDFTYSIRPEISPVPVPAAVWLFGTALIGLVGFSKRRKAA